MTLRALNCTASFFALVLCATQQVFAATYPTRPIRVVVPYTPGGITDIAARFIQPYLVEALNQQLVVDNRGGASGSIGSKLVASAPADGHTLLYNDATTLALNMTFIKPAPYDSVRDFTPIAIVGRAEIYLIAHPSLPARTVSELVDYLKKAPRAVNYASAGNGSALHMAMEQLRYQAKGFNVMHVPFKSGGLAMPSLVTGETPVMMSSLPPVAQYIKNGALRAIAVTAPSRMPALPDVPAVAETFPGFEFFIVNAFWGPARVPKAVVQRLHSEIAKIIDQAEFRDRLGRIGLQPKSGSPQELHQFVAASVGRFDKIARATGALGQ